MGRFCSRGVCLIVAVLGLLDLAGCGGGSKRGTPLYPGHITLTPTATMSLTLGGSINFTASVQTSSGTNLNVPVTFTSSDTSILTLASNGVACAGQWDIAFTTCTPGNVGVATVTASALGATSVPTYVFVHPPIDNITVEGMFPTGTPVQEPCLSQTQSMMVEAHAYSQGTDITASVGPFTWTSNNPTVVNLIPIINSYYSFPTNQATARAVTPGITNIIASANGVSSTTFQQPQYANTQGATSPILDFFATCPVQNISLEVGQAGSGQTTFIASKSTSQSIVATITDVMGNSSLPNTNGGVVLTKIPLTWASSQPGVFTIAANCGQTCSAATGSPGSVAITASCSPPSCNVGFPLIPATLSTPAQITACTQFFQPLVPNKSFNCQELIPVPVYASPVFIYPTGDVTLQPPAGAIGGVITGTTGAAAVFAASTGCEHETPSTCFTSAYYFSTTKGSVGAANLLPAAPNSALFDLSGARLYMGSDFGAELITPANFGTSTNPFAPLGTVTGRVLAISNSGTAAAFSDTLHTPNQVYIVNTSSTLTQGATALNISGASTAAFSPDGLKTFIVAGPTGNSLYIYSTLQALQGPIPLSGAANNIVFSPNGAFAYIAEASGAAGPNLSVFSTCNNQFVGSVPLPANPLITKVLPNLHIDGRDSYGNPIPDGIHVLVMDSTGFNIVTSTLSPPAAGTLCPQGLNFISDDPARTAQRIDLDEGTLQPVNFFTSPDGSQLYVANASSSTIFIYNFLVGSVIGGIPLLNSATPVSAEMSVDGGTIVIAGSDSLVHVVTTAVGGTDTSPPLTFPNLPNYLNAFCSITPSAGPCSLTIAATKP
ncbi:MAG TPA: hypothetical protein VGS78_05120 [Candidatus Sulfotelmatobacter sp.]|nr:hypothetical protein [Candidatus Sulfotelmatobacter sp.]